MYRASITGSHETILENSRRSNNRTHPLAGALGLGLVILLSIATIQNAVAHGGATGIVKERMDVMSSIGKASKRLNKMARGKEPLDPETVRELADQMSEHAERIPSLFPDTEHSRTGKMTEARPTIWERWSDFEDLAEALAQESAALSAVSDDDPKVVAAQLRKVGATCKDCHKLFRVKK